MKHTNEPKYATKMDGCRAVEWETIEQAMEHGGRMYLTTGRTVHIYESRGSSFRIVSTFQKSTAITIKP